MSTAEAIGMSIFLAPASKHTYSTLESASTLVMVPLQPLLYWRKFLLCKQLEFIRGSYFPKSLGFSLPFTLLQRHCKSNGSLLSRCVTFADSDFGKQLLIDVKFTAFNHSSQEYIEYIRIILSPDFRPHPFS